MKIDSLSMGEAAEGLASKKGRIGAVWGKPNHGGVSGEKEWRAAGGRFRSRETGSHRCRRFDQTGRDAAEGGLKPGAASRGPALSQGSRILF